MRGFHRLLSFATIISTAVSAPDSSSTVTIYAWPVTSDSPAPLAQVQLSLSPKLLSFSAPSHLSSSDYVRIGLYNQSSGGWRGSAATGAWFGDHVDREILLHIDNEGKPYHVGVEGTEILDPAAEKKLKKKEKTKKDKTAHKEKKVKTPVVWRKGETTVELVTTKNPPHPKLNKPIVLNAEGLVDAPLEREKSFIQKYWWAIAIFLLVNVVAGMGGDDGGSGRT